MQQSLRRRIRQHSCNGVAGADLVAEFRQRGGDRRLLRLLHLDAALLSQLLIAETLGECLIDGQHRTTLTEPPDQNLAPRGQIVGSPDLTHREQFQLTVGGVRLLVQDGDHRNCLPADRHRAESVVRRTRLIDDVGSGHHRDHDRNDDRDDNQDPPDPTAHRPPRV